MDDVKISKLDRFRFNFFLKKSRFQITINLYCLMTLIMSVRNGECY